MNFTSSASTKSTNPKRKLRARKELISTLPEIFFVFEQIGAYHNWRVMVSESCISKTCPQYRLRMMHNATMGASLINLRALDDFFMDGKRDNDIIANDFPSFRQKNPGPFLTSADKDTIHKRMAHLTWTRLSLEPRPFPIRKMMQQAISRMLVFLRYLEQDFLSFNDEHLVDVKALINVLPDYLTDNLWQEIIESYSDVTLNPVLLR